MALFHNEKLFQEIEATRLDINEKMKDSLIREPFLADFSRRFCWSSNAIEGNTLSLDETVAFIEFDEKFCSAVGDKGSRYSCDI